MTQKNCLEQFLGWKVEPDPDRYGAFIVPQIEQAQRRATGAEDVERLEENAALLLEAAPELHRACRRALEWFQKARQGTLDQLEEALGHHAPVDALDRALREANGEYRPVCHVCANCGRTFSREEPLQPIERFWQRVEAGEIVPSGQCPDCGALCYLKSGEDS